MSDLPDNLPEPAWSDETYGVALYHGDCLAVMSGFPDASVDSIVTDPPYGLSFMGKAWDHGVPGVDIWRECLRVLRPGGHLLAFGGTRTQHRLVVAIEDAGFDIRDMIAWVYGQGFPKSTNLDRLKGHSTCGCDGDTVPYDHEGLPRKQATERHLPDMWGSDVSTSEHSGEGAGQVLQHGLSEHGTPIAGRSEFPGSEVRIGQPSVEGGRDISPPQGKLRPGEVRSGSRMGESDGTQGRLHNGTPSHNGGVVRVPADSDGSSPPRRSRSDEQQQGQPRAVAGQPEPQAGGAWPICDRCGLPVLPSGLGTALKPALEPICMARKPFVGTVAANVLEHGTGAINVDGCRVGTSATDAKAMERCNTPGSGRHHAGGGLLGQSFERSRGSGNLDTTQGRWPANFIHDGSPEVVGLMPETTSGHLGAGTTDNGKTDCVYGEYKGRVISRDFGGDSGSAARFFYCAKASKADRDQGMEGECRQYSRTSGRTIPHDGPYERNASAARNAHPTVKPVDLMQYLCRLVTPPGGIVLDPFMGSGSTGKAARREGFGFIGIELEQESFDAAVSRVGREVVQEKGGPLFVEHEPAGLFEAANAP